MPPGAAGEAGESLRLAEILLGLSRVADLGMGLEPGEAAEELLARMLDARRYRRAAAELAFAFDRAGNVDQARTFASRASRAAAPRPSR